MYKVTCTEPGRLLWSWIWADEERKDFFVLVPLVPLRIMETRERREKRDEKERKRNPIGPQWFSLLSSYFHFCFLRLFPLLQLLLVLPLMLFVLVPLVFLIPLLMLMPTRVTRRLYLILWLHPFSQFWSSVIHNKGSRQSKILTFTHQYLYSFFHKQCLFLPIRGTS